MKLILTLLLFATLSCASAPTEPKCNHDPRVRCCGLIPEAECAHVQAGKTYTLEELAGMVEIRNQAQRQGHVWLERIKQRQAKGVQPETTVIVVKVQVEYPKPVLSIEGGHSVDLVQIGREISFGDGIGHAFADSMWATDSLLGGFNCDSSLRSIGDSCNYIGVLTLTYGDTAAPL